MFMSDGLVACDEFCMLDTFLCFTKSAKSSDVGIPSFVPWFSLFRLSTEEKNCLPPKRVKFPSTSCPFHYLSVITSHVLHVTRINSPPSHNAWVLFNSLLRNILLSCSCTEKDVRFNFRPLLCTKLICFILCFSIFRDHFWCV